MKFTTKQINKILNVQEFVAMSDTLARIYLEYDDKEYLIDTFTDRDRIYRIYCASIYNLIKAIQDSKEYFIGTKKYKEFEKIINQEYVANDNRYYKKENYKATLFKIIETIRHQVNHSLKDDEDNNILFASYIDFEILENLRIIINDIFSEIYDQIDNKKVKKIILNKPKIKYTMDKLSNKVDELKLRIPERENVLNEILKKNNARSLELFDQLFNSDNIYDLFTKDPKAIRKFELADKEIQESLKRVEEYINSKGTDFEKEALKIYKEFIENIGNGCKKETEENINQLKEKLNNLKEKYNF